MFQSNLRALHVFTYVSLFVLCWCRKPILREFGFIVKILAPLWYQDKLISYTYTRMLPTKKELFFESRQRAKIPNFREIPGLFQISWFSYLQFPSILYNKSKLTVRILIFVLAEEENMNENTEKIPLKSHNYYATLRFHDRLPSRWCREQDTIYTVYCLGVFSCHSTP